MKRCMFSLLFLVLIFFLMLYFHSAVYAGDTTLSVPVVAQEHSQWCWVGSSSAVMQYYGRTLSQCQIANWAWSRTDCCGNTTFSWNHACNQPNYLWGTGGSLQGILTHWNVTTIIIETYISKSTVVSTIDGGKPFVINWSWNAGGGHYVVGYGYGQNGDYVDYMDPWPGHGVTRSAYDWVVSSAGVSGHTWAATLKSTRTPTEEVAAVPVLDKVGAILFLTGNGLLIAYYLRRTGMLPRQ